MRLWGKNKEIVVHCYTDRAEVYNYFPIVDNKKIIPGWFKKLKAPFFNSPENAHSNLKLCSGFTDLFKTGFSIPLWSDLFIEVGEKGSDYYRWQYSDNFSEIGIHGEHQYGKHFKEEEYQHLKLMSPWLLQCEDNINFLAVEPFWQFKELENISILPGSVQFYSQPSTNINLFMRREAEKQKILLNAGMPIYTYVPITERKVRIETHLVSSKKISSLRKQAYSMKFLNHYGAALKLTKERKCPYKFDVEE